jgi:hypothetical protein
MENVMEKVIEKVIEKEKKKKKMMINKKSYIYFLNLSFQNKRKKNKYLFIIIML